MFCFGLRVVYTPTPTLTHLTARCGIQAKREQHFVTQLEVPFTYVLTLAKPHNCYLNRYHHHRRVAPLSSQMELLQSCGCVRGLVAMQLYTYRDIRMP